ncbi:DUF4373 domain-containing protein [uncultured Phocaeicola sp.]|uniref:DUF4373 domain-containing protein n=1 Tax=uncultured Phocaeicola sp. TaxID=990718 RepID=UPI0025D8E373|nr:DUF4373 domain-containing protein [uncultured Phocaeicola sp.]
MGRNKKIGLDYFPFDIDFFQDLRIRKLIKYQGGKAVTVYALLLCNIYKQGYYMRWDEELPFFVSEQTGFEEAYIREVIKCCLVIGLFSKELYDSEKILTSKGIQERYQKICDLCRRNNEICEYNIISSEDISFSSEEKPVSSAKSTQSKVNKSKVNKSKENKKEISPEGDTKKDELSLQPHPQVEHVGFVRLQEYFNTTFRGKLSMVVSMTESRRKAVKARIAQYDKETVFIVLKKVAASPFLLGCNDRNWKCDFDWIFKAANFTKILEGNYDEKGNSSSPIGRKESVSRLTDLAEAILTGSETT